jgi:hypothetical protein
MRNTAGAVWGGFLHRLVRPQEQPSMNYVVGLVFLLVAVLVALFGDRTVQEKGGPVLKAVSWPRGRAAQLKWAFSAALGFVGGWFIFVGVK